MLRFLLITTILLGALIGGGLYGYKYVVGGDVYDFVDYFSEPYEISQDDLVKLYESERDGLIAGYQRKGDPWATGYTDYEAASTFPANPGVHSGRYMMTYVNDAGFDTYTKYGGGEMPVGSVIAKESFKLRPNGDFIPYTLFIMEKVGADKAPDAGGWYYDRVLYDGTKGLKVDQQFCHGCHKAFAHQDFLGYPVKEARLNFTATDEAEVSQTPLSGDIERGETAFQACLACHSVGDNASNKIGPVLNNVIGRQAGSYPGYAYSGSLKAAGENGLTWNEDLIFEWLAGPTDFLKDRLDDPSASSKMFLNIDDPQMRSDIIAYLATHSSSEN